MLSLIAAVAENNAIGNENRLLYWLPNDLKRFKQLTTGHTIIMGRKTFESLPKGALPNRRNIVLTRSEQTFPGADTFHSLEEALQHTTLDEDVYIIGGESLYRFAIDKADRLCITLVYDTPVVADAFFPEIDSSIWKISSKEDHTTDEKHKYEYSFIDYIRR